MSKQICVHGIELILDTGFPPKPNGCVICHNLPQIGNWNPYSWPLVKYDHEFGEQAFIDINVVLSQRDELLRKITKLEKEE